MPYTSAKYGLSKRYTNRCVLHHCKFLMWNKSWEDISYVHVSAHNSDASIKSYARKLPSSKRAISDTFSRATGVLAVNNASLPKKTKNNQATQPKVFSPETHSHMQKAVISSNSSFAIVNDPWKIIQ